MDDADGERSNNYDHADESGANTSDAACMAQVPVIVIAIEFQVRPWLVE